ncbi:hypothetical protein S1R3Y_000037 [Vibrio phage vB_ValP_VA-RY-3]|nr:hypothetical protein S1R3Y_000037 [Vibrio phage vB_ValP_VA-RY-3]
MPKVTANGKAFNFPEGTTEQQMAEAVDSYFAGGATAPPEQELSGLEQVLGGVTDFVRQGMPEAKEFVPDIKQKVSAPVLPYGMNQSVIDQRNRDIERHNQYERSFIGDEERQRLRREEEQRPFLSGVAEGIGHIADQFNYGTKLSPDFLPESIQDILDYRIGGDNTLSREEAEEAIANEMGNINERYDITRHENPVSTTVGEMIPFLATGGAGGKIIDNVVKATANPLKRANIALNQRMGNQAAANRIANRPDYIMSPTRQMSNEVYKGTLTGAAEGAAQYDQDALTGAALSAVGGAGGMFGPTKVLNSMRSEWDAAGKKLIKEMEEEGFQITPGVRTNNRTLQTEEAALRNSDAYGQDAYNLVDRPNERVMTKLAGDAIGLDTRNRDMLSQQELADHMANLSSQYKQLEADTVGKFSQKSYGKINSLLKNLQPTQNRNQSKAARHRYEVMKDAVSEMRTVLQPFTDTKGKFTVQKFDGARYQEAAQYLNEQISKAYNDGDKTLARNLKEVKKELDSSIESGMGKTEAKQWRDLNERYAMTRMLMDSGLTPSGKVNPLGLTSAVMNKDEAMRTLTGKGGRIKEFQKIARYNDVLNDVEGGSLTGLGASEPSARRGLIKRSSDYMLKPLATTMLDYKLNTSRLPFIGPKLSPVHGISPNASVHLNRAFAQTETPKDAAEDAYDSLMRTLGVR